MATAERDPNPWLRTSPPLAVDDDEPDAPSEPAPPAPGPGGDK